LSLISKRYVLTDEHSNAYSRHIKPVEEGLDVGVNLHALTLSLVFIDALRNGSHYTVMPSLDAF